MADFSYIVLDLEWNQPLNPDSAIREPFFFDSEIIEIGALRLDERFRETGSFKTFIRPRFYPHMNGDVVRLTKMRAQDLENAPEFPRAYADFAQWCGEDCCLCTWGPDDIPVLMDNLLMHGMDAEMPCCYDLQRIFGHEIMRDDRQCSLERAMELLHLTPGPGPRCPERCTEHRADLRKDGPGRVHGRIRPAVCAVSPGPEGRAGAGA